jgi:hypothetical protein
MGGITPLSHLFLPQIEQNGTVETVLRAQVSSISDKLAGFIGRQAIGSVYSFVGVACVKGAYVCALPGWLRDLLKSRGAGVGNRKMQWRAF